LAQLVIVSNRVAIPEKNVKPHAGGLEVAVNGGRSSTRPASGSAGAGRSRATGRCLVPLKDCSTARDRAPRPNGPSRLVSSAAAAHGRTYVSRLRTAGRIERQGDLYSRPTRAWPIWAPRPRRCRYLVPSSSRSGLDASRVPRRCLSIWRSAIGAGSPASSSPRICSLPRRASVSAPLDARAKVAYELCLL
jgi:hypothetical protein